MDVGSLTNFIIGSEATLNDSNASKSNTNIIVELHLSLENRLARSDKRVA